jgi:Rrf2 family cysteine metabolism transcriptional repressor
MKLSARSKHGLRAIVELAIHYGKGYLQMKDIAEAGGISKKYIEEMFSKLIFSGMVKSYRGPKGGYVLKVPPSEINLSRIVSVLEWPEEPIGCGKHKKFSKRCNECVTERIWAKLHKNASDYFESTTLQDLLDMKK